IFIFGNILIAVFVLAFSKLPSLSPYALGGMMAATFEIAKLYGPKYGLLFAATAPAMLIIANATRWKELLATVPAAMEDLGWKLVLMSVASTCAMQAMLDRKLPLIPAIGHGLFMVALAMLTIVAAMVAGMTATKPDEPVATPPINYDLLSESEKA